jgi:hypothetical protein
LGGAVARWLAAAGAPHVSRVLDRERCRELAVETVRAADRGGETALADTLAIVELAYEAVPW